MLLAGKTIVLGFLLSMVVHFKLVGSVRRVEAEAQQRGVVELEMLDQGYFWGGLAAI